MAPSTRSAARRNTPAGREVARPAAVARKGRANAPRLPASAGDCSRGTLGAWLGVGLLFAASLGLLVWVLRSLPPTDQNWRDVLRVPVTIRDAQSLKRFVGQWSATHGSSVLALLAATYVFMQSFTIPGSIWLSILLGALFGFWTAITVVCVCSAVGATCAFLISKHLAGPLVQTHLASRLELLRVQTARNRQHMLSYILFLRVTPLVPNWVVNLLSPHVGVPLVPFFFGTLLGVAPLSMIHVQAGEALDALTDWDSLSLFSDPWNIARVAGMAVVALIPVFGQKLLGHVKP